MREILFRGKRKDNGEWVYGFLADEYRIINDDCLTTYYGNGGIESDAFFIIPETVGEFTGLTDKNGKKIFEGDIIRDKYGIIFEIMVSGNGYFVAINDDYWEFINDLDEIEVIGNVHDNPELLEV